MKYKITTLFLAIITATVSFAETYIHFTSTDDADSIVVQTINDSDSIVYYAPAVVEEQGIDWDNVAESTVQASALTDADGNSYSAVKIGTQIWMAENLAVSATNITGGLDGDAATASCGYSGAYVWSNTDASYGKLYSWEAAKLACPSGWHLPSADEWKTLKDYLTTSYSDTEGTALKSTTGWNSDGNGTDNYSFTALPGGGCNFNGAHGYQGRYGYWWSSTPNGSDYAYDCDLGYNYAGVDSNRSNRRYGQSVRCLRN